jgi:raffinose/stachyose/melibiose transport system permease protein
MNGNHREISRKKHIKCSALMLKIFKFVFLTFIVSISVGPILWALASSFKTHQEIFSGSALALPKSINLANYKRALELAPVWKFFLNSMIIGTTNTALCLLIVSGCAYAVARFEFKMKGLIVAIISAALILPAQSISQPIFVIFKSLNLFDTKSGLIFIYTAFGIPVTFFIMRSYFLSIPRALDESAYIDGAGFMRTFSLIIMPLAMPAIATAGILQFISSWNEFYYALMLTSSNNARTVPISLGYYTSMFNSSYGAMFAAVIMTIMPTIILFIITQEQVISGLTAGALKG